MWHGIAHIHSWPPAAGVHLSSGVLHRSGYDTGKHVHWLTACDTGISALVLCGTRYVPTVAE